MTIERPEIVQEDHMKLDDLMLDRGGCLSVLIGAMLFFGLVLVWIL